ncbi:MAG: hypothetical protein WC375_06515 [Methanomassiliicoccales archaeon]
MPHPWERQPDESPEAYRAFCVYRSLGTEKRSHEAVALTVCKRRKEGGGTPGYIPAWSVKYHWVERATAYDDHLDEIRRNADEKAIVEMSKKHAKGMRKIFDKGLKRIEALGEEDIRGGLALELAMNGMKGERLARGLTTDSTAQTINGEGSMSHPLGEAIRTDPAVREKAYELLNAASRRPAGAESK